MSEELLLNDRRGKLIRDFKFFFKGAKILYYLGIQTIDLPSPDQKHCPLGYQALLAAIDFIIATNFSSDREQLRLLKNEERKLEKVT